MNDRETMTRANTEQCVATIKITDCAHMTAKGRLALAEWLRDQALAVEQSGHNYDDRFTARYWVSPRRKSK